MPAPTFVAASNTTYASRTNTTVTKPTGTVDNDLVVLFFLNGRASSYGPAPTPPPGFTLLSGTQVNGWGFYVSTWIYYRVASSEGASWTFTHAAITTQAFAVAYRGVDTTTPLDATATTNTGGGTTRTWTGLTTATADAMLLALGHDFADTANNLTPPAGLTERIEVNPLVYAAEQVRATPGATGNFSHAVNNNSGESKWAAALLALRPTSSSGVTGTLNATSPKATADLNGSVTVTGTMAVMTPVLESSIAGSTGGIVAGTMSAMVPPLTADAAGTVTVGGTLDATTRVPDGDTTGTVTVTGTTAATLPLLSASFGGSTTVADAERVTPWTLAVTIDWQTLTVAAPSRTLTLDAPAPRTLDVATPPARTLELDAPAQTLTITTPGWTLELDA